MLHRSPLGKQIPQPTTYSPHLLYPMLRHFGRDGAGLDAALVSRGVDIWTAYEMSWLNERGVPQIGVLHIELPADSPCIIESKSFKLYLNALADTVFPSRAHVLHTLSQDISAAAEAPCDVRWICPEGPQSRLTAMTGINIDAEPIDCPSFVRDPELLCANGPVVTEHLYSDLLKSNCPVTAQPDWASLMVHYTGAQIDRARLLRYILSYRSHTGFHELCVEQIFSDILLRCAPSALSVFARYTRRGGLDINPFRTTFEKAPENIRTFRQ